MLMTLAAGGAAVSLAVALLAEAAAVMSWSTVRLSAAFVLYVGWAVLR